MKLPYYKNSKTAEVIIAKENLNVSVLSGLAAILESILIHQKRTTLRNNRKETQDLLILRKEPIPETVNPRKIDHEDYLMPPEKESPHKMSRPFRRKEDYEGDINEENRNTDYSRSNKGDFVKNLDKEKEYKEDNELKEYSSMVNLKKSLNDQI